MNPEEKHTEESLVMLFLREDYLLFPGGRMQKSESPDFILKTTGKKKIGIELTRLHDPSNHLTGTKNENNQLVDRLISKAMAYFEEEQKLSLYVKFYFSFKNLPGENDLEFYAKYLSLYVTKAIAGKDMKKYQQISITNDLPDFLSHIYIIHHPNMKVAFWSHGKSFLLYDLQKEMIQTNISGKEEKLKLYRQNRLDQYWLVIYTMKLNPEKGFNVGNKLEKWKFKSIFDKIIFYEVFEQKVFDMLES